jgi:uncharacterized membrane protein
LTKLKKQEIKDAFISEKTKTSIVDGMAIQNGSKTVLTPMGVIMVLGVAFTMIGFAALVTLVVVKAPKKEETAKK